MNWIEHQANIFSAITELIEKDEFLISNNVNERSITHKLGGYLISPYNDYDVDCEYNREGEITKYLDGDQVYPDVIIHDRGNHNRNLIVIEVKKENGQPPDDDFKKLGAFTSTDFPYQYQFGIHITFNKFPSLDFRVFRSGEMDHELTGKVITDWSNL